MKPKKSFPRVKPANLAQYIEFTSVFTRRRFTNFTKTLGLSVAQTYEIAQLYEEIHVKGLDDEKVVRLLEEVEKNLTDIQTNLHVDVQKQLVKLKKLNINLKLGDKIKISIPIISHVLRYDMDGNWKETFSKIWLDLKNGTIFISETEFSSKGFGDISADKTAVRQVLGTTIYKTDTGNFEFTCGTAICVDGAPDAYGPKDSGSDLTSSAGHNKGDVRKYKKDSNGKFLIVNGEKVPELFYEDTGYYISTTAYVYSGFPDDVQERYVNANIVPYSVLSEVSRKALELAKGDLVYVKNNKNGLGKWTGFLETRNADDRIGEISSAAADAIGVNSNPRNGGQEGGITFIFYPNTAPNGNFKNDAEARNYIHRNGKNIEAGKPVDKNPRII
jgi:hypothetical protein